MKRPTGRESVSPAAAMPEALPAKAAKQAEADGTGTFLITKSRCPARPRPLGFAEIALGQIPSKQVELPCISRFRSQGAR